MSLLVGLILTALNGPVGTESRGVAVFTHRDTAPLNEPTFLRMAVCQKASPMKIFALYYYFNQSQNSIPAETT